jgi:predicted MFS family arabinose efflux permease
MWVQLRRILSVPWGRRFLALSVLQGAGGFGTVSIVATHLHGTHGMSLSTAGAVVALFGLGGVMYMSVARHLIKRLGEQGMALVGGGSMGGALLLVGLSPWWQLSPLAMLIGGFGFFMLHNTLQAHATQLAPQARGLGVSLFATSLFLGQSIGVMLAGQSIERLGSGIIVSIGGLMLIAVAVGVCLQLRRPQT